MSTTVNPLSTQVWATVNAQNEVFTSSQTVTTALGARRAAWRSDSENQNLYNRDQIKAAVKIFLEALEMRKRLTTHQQTITDALRALPQPYFHTEHKIFLTSLQFEVPVLDRILEIIEKIRGQYQLAMQRNTALLTTMKDYIDGSGAHLNTLCSKFCEENELGISYIESARSTMLGLGAKVKCTYDDTHLQKVASHLELSISATENSYQPISPETSPEGISEAQKELLYLQQALEKLEEINPPGNTITHPSPEGMSDAPTEVEAGSPASPQVTPAALSEPDNTSDVERVSLEPTQTDQPASPPKPSTKAATPTTTTVSLTPLSWSAVVASKATLTSSKPEINKRKSTSRAP